MKVIDMHIHARATKPEPATIIKNMEEAGIYGGAVFSNYPVEYCPAWGGTSAEERIEETLGWCEGYEGRLFPVLYMHPYEKDAIKVAEKAKEKGIVAIKIICSNFYVYEEESVKFVSALAEMGLPVIFHAGILYDEGCTMSSIYNHPVYWESLIQIKNLRFSLAHGAWPWTDELIALYGKYAYSRKRMETAEMFFDLTPGTPPVYRRDAFNKLLNLGIETIDHLMFGVDNTADDYSVDYAKGWIDRDNKILTELGADETVKQKYFADNFMRFLGK